jgi:uroporphyrinogen-III synthase
MSQRLAVESALAKLREAEAVMPRDVAAEELARRYAHDIDDAAVVSTQAAKALRELAGQIDHELYSRVAALFDRIESTAVLATLGPKLLAVLVELGMTPRARADTTRKGGAPNVGGTPSESPIGRLRGERVARLKAT